MIKQPFSAVISDLDGTLLDENHQLNEKTAQTLQQLEQKGIDIVLASGRNYADMIVIAQKAGLKNAALITSNGAMTYDLQGNILNADYIDETVAVELMNVPFDTSTTFLNTYQEKGWFISIDMPMLNKFHQDSKFTYQVIDFKKHHGREVEKLFFIAKTTDDLLPIEKRIKDKLGDYLSMTYSMPLCLEIMHKGVNKASALTRLLASREYDLSDCIAFGDGLNDKEMLSSVGKGCIMYNADKRLVELLPNLERIGSHSDLAVTHYLRQLFALN
ncbi:MAG: Cof-type HAD-IIB family hydrolase [Gammaproteobacteria bacterium]|nr:Cof-type HAD-IIB family hydrolase [Gammaproteobacteria bacterium]